MVLSIIFGIIIEVLQGTVTAYRSSDINDVLANTIGVLLMSVVIGMKNKYKVN
jgi:glycopeptide antibiotics resistance protein